MIINVDENATHAQQKIDVTSRLEDLYEEVSKDFNLPNNIKKVNLEKINETI